MTLCKTTDVAALQEIFGFGLPNVWIVRRIEKLLRHFVTIIMRLVKDF